MPLHVVLMAGGQLPRPSLLKKFLPDDFVLVAVDGGANHCAKLNLRPQYIVGDLDSVSTATRTRFKNANWVPLPDQNFSDLQKAFDFAFTLEPEQITLFAAFGLRGDHHASNLLILSKLPLNCPINCIDLHGQMQILDPGSYRFTGADGSPVSFFSLGPLHKLSLDGVKYTLQDKDYPDHFNGTSNSFDGKEARVSFTGGRLFIYRPFTELVD